MSRRSPSASGSRRRGVVVDHDAGCGPCLNGGVPYLNGGVLHAVKVPGEWLGDHCNADFDEGVIFRGSRCFCQWSCRGLGLDAGGFAVPEAGAGCRVRVGVAAGQALVGLSEPRWRSRASLRGRGHGARSGVRFCATLCAIRVPQCAMPRTIPAPQCPMWGATPPATHRGALNGMTGAAVFLQIVLYKPRHAFMVMHWGIQIGSTVPFQS